MQSYGMSMEITVFRYIDPSVRSLPTASFSFLWFEDGCVSLDIHRLDPARHGRMGPVLDTLRGVVVVDSDLELEISFNSGDYTVRVVNTPVGGATSGAFHLDVKAMLARLPELEATVLSSAVTARRTIPAAEKPLHEVGEQLFHALFPESVRGTYRACLGAAQHSAAPLRVVLRLAAPELAALPWELLFDPETGSYLCQDQPLLRRIPAADFAPRPLEVEPPLRILGIVASPNDLPRLDAEVEKQHLIDALAEPATAGLIELAWAPQATWHGIQSSLLDGPWHVLHFIGHGDYDAHGREGRIALESPAGRTDMVRASNLMQLLREAEPTPRLVVLNSCSSGEAGTEDLFSGTAAALVRGRISAVAAMQFTISDAAAIAFARGFYGAIAHGRDVDKAASSGRRSIMGLGTLEWVTPVLYVRGGSTKLFTLTELPVRPAGVAPRAPDVKQEAQRAAQLRDLYHRANVEYRMERYRGALSLFNELLNLEPEYGNAVSLRDDARHHLERAELYWAARKAEDAGKWEDAARGYSLVQKDSSFGDAANRLNNCLANQRVVDLQETIRVRAQTGNWQAVMDADAELAELDEATSAKEGFTSRTRNEIVYAEGRLAEEAGNLDKARRCYEQIIAKDPDFRDVNMRYETCRRTDTGSSPQTQSTETPALMPSDQATSRPGIDMRRVREIMQTPQQFLCNHVATLSFSPDGGRLATAISGDKARIWDAVSGAELRAIKPKGFSASVATVAFSPDGVRLAFGCNDGTVQVWNTVTGQQVLSAKFATWPVTVLAAVFSTDGTRLATGSDDSGGSARIWDPLTGAQLLEIRHNKAVHSVAFSQDGKWLATGSMENTARIWDAATGDKLLEVTDNDSILAVALNSDGSRLATGGQGKVARVWDTDTGSEMVSIQYVQDVIALAFSPDGKWLAIGSKDNTARIWDAATADQLLCIRFEKGVSAIAFSPDGTRLVTGSSGVAKIWDLQ